MFRRLSPKQTATNKNPWLWRLACCTFQIEAHLFERKEYHPSNNTEGAKLTLEYDFLAGIGMNCFQGDSWCMSVEVSEREGTS